jgi:hypothetical protein
MVGAASVHVGLLVLGGDWRGWALKVTRHAYHVTTRVRNAQGGGLGRCRRRARCCLLLGHCHDTCCAPRWQRLATVAASPSSSLRHPGPSQHHQSVRVRVVPQPEQRGVRRFLRHILPACAGRVGSLGLLGGLLRWRHVLRVRAGSAASSSLVSPRCNFTLQVAPHSQDSLCG